MKKAEVVVGCVDEGIEMLLLQPETEGEAPHYLDVEGLTGGVEGGHSLPEAGFTSCFFHRPVVQENRVVISPNLE